MEVMSLSGKPVRMCSQVVPASPLWKAPSREARKICESGMTVTPRMFVTYEARLFEVNVEPLSVDRKTLVRLAATTVVPFDPIETKSFSPSTGPPTHDLP